jgi:hypothetical protein
MRLTQLMLANVALWSDFFKFCPKTIMLFLWSEMKIGLSLSKIFHFIDKDEVEIDVFLVSS